MTAIAHRTLEKYTSRHRTLVTKFPFNLLDQDAPDSLITTYYHGGGTDVQYRDPSELELALYFQSELDQKHAYYALLGRSGKNSKSEDYRKYSSFESDLYALLYFFRREISECPQMDPSRRVEIELAISVLGEIGVQLNKLRKNMAIYQEAKSGRPVNFPVNDWTRLSAALMSTWSYLVERQQKTYALRAAIFLSVGFATGAKPGAWACATWADDERTAVRFFAPTRDVAESNTFNSKSWNDKEQPNARYRDVKFDPTYQEHIQRHFHYMDQIFEGCDTYVGRDIAIGTYVKGCGKAILAARNKITEWAGDPTRAYTLSVARSQFPALQSLTDSIREYDDLGWTSATTSAASQYGLAMGALGARGDVIHQTNASA